MHMRECLQSGESKKREKRIDYINYEITSYMTLVSSLKMNESDSTTCNALYKCFSDIERIGVMQSISYSIPPMRIISFPAQNT